MRSVLRFLASIAFGAMVSTIATTANASVDICGDEEGAAGGLCQAYCEALDCASNPRANAAACGHVKANFSSLTGRARLPCEIKAAPVAIFADNEYPEGLDIAADGTIYAGILTTGEIKAIHLDGSVETFTTVRLDGGFMPGLTFSSAGEMFLATAAPGALSDGHGVLKVDGSGHVSLFAEFPADTFPNHITFDAAGDMLVSESSPGSIYKVDGVTGAVSLWSNHPRLLGEPVSALGGLRLGANGSAISPDGGRLFVSNSSTSEILMIEINPDGSAGALSCFAGSAPDCAINVSGYLSGPDGLVFDAQGSLYIASGLNDTILRIDTGGVVERIWTGRPLEWPTVLRFGTLPGTETTLFTTNIDISRLFGATGEPYPGVAKVDVGLKWLFR